MPSISRLSHFPIWEGAETRGTGIRTGLGSLRARPFGLEPPDDAPGAMLAVMLVSACMYSGELLDGRIVAP